MVMITDSLIKKILREATTDSGSRGSYTPPLQPGLRDFQNKLDPFTTPVSDYKSPLVQYDSYDHTWDLRSDQIKKLEKTAKKVTDFIKHHPYSTFTDEDGGIINQTPSGKNKKKSEIVPIKRNDKKLNEITTTTTAGEYSGPQELGMRNWTDDELGAFKIKSDIPVNNQIIKKFIKKNVLKTIGGWEPRKGKFQIDTGYAGEKKEKKVDKKGVIDNDVINWYKNFYKSKLKENFMNEDLAVWFGKKKKPKGSSQPKGPWVDICRKIDGKHPPCGRSDTSKGAYPKCRAAGVAGKMSDTQKRSACQQKRQAEKKDTQTGKGQKPVMTSYKPKNKLKEDMRQQIITLTESDIMKIVRRVLKEQNVGDDVSNLGTFYWFF